MSNIKVNGTIEGKSIVLQYPEWDIVNMPKIEFKSHDANGTNTSTIKIEGSTLKLDATSILLNNIDVLKILSIDDIYLDPNIAVSEDVYPKASYITFKSNLLGNKKLAIIWGTTPKTDNNGYLTGAPTLVPWIPTSSEGRVLNLFKNTTFNVHVNPYGGKQYNYGWRVINYMKDGNAGFNVRYGNTSDDIGFNFLMIGIIEDEA